MDQIKRELRFLKIYAGLATVGWMVLFAVIFKLHDERRFREIDVERINIVEADGKLRMVLSNKALQHPGAMDGITYDERRGQRPPGMMFFNEKGDEVGGLVFDGAAGMGQGGSLTFDKFRGDQTIQFIHEEEPNGTYFAGLKVNDQNTPLNDLLERQKQIAKLSDANVRESAIRALREQGLLTTERLRIGKESDKSTILKMSDAHGKVRIEFKVAENGDAKLNFLDDAGGVVYSLPPEAKRRK